MKTGKRKSFFTLLIILVMQIGSFAQETKVRVAFTKAGPEEKYKQYITWLEQVNPGYEYVNLWGMPVAEAVKELSGCQGLVVTGGADVYPGLYRREKDAGRCGPFDRVRDGFELTLIRTALDLKLPICCICRGEQIFNVFQGGTLIIDIPQDSPSIVPHNLSTPEGASHEINIDKKSLLYSWLKVEKGKVNSFHHQAVDKLAPTLTPWAKSPDGIIEAYGWKEPDGKSFLMALQWHPERMMKDELFSKKLAEKFLEEVGHFGKK